MHNHPSGRHAQRGITFIGLVILVVFVGTFVYGGIRLVPLYLEYFNIAKTLEKLPGEFDGSVSPQAIRVSLEKRFSIEDISSISYKDVEITRDGQTWLVRAAYDAQTPFVANVGFVVHFDKSVRLAGSATP